MQSNFVGQITAKGWTLPQHWAQPRATTLSASTTAAGV
jgi:hypothetical protein